MSYRRTAAALLVALLLAPWSLAQERGAKKDSKEPEAQYWIVLLDVSLSSEQRDREQSQALGTTGYRLRNEILVMMQTLVASLSEKNQNENNYLDVYVFGNQTRRIQKLPVQPVQWSDIQGEGWWNEQIPGDIGSRTDYISAIGTAADLFNAQHKEAKKNLLLISDGELDLGKINRKSQGTLEKEELDRYRNFLRTDNPVMKELARNKVSVFTLALDEGLHGRNDEERQKLIYQRLNEARLGGPSFLEKGLRVVEDLAGRVGPDGRMIESEGPYVLRALAEQFGGKARSVRYDNVLDVMWDTIFPDQERRRLVLPPGTNKVIVSAPVESPIQVKIWKDKKKKDVTLQYDKSRTSYQLTPPDAEIDKVNVRATSQYATWLVESRNLAEVNLSPGQEAYHRFSVLPVNNVRFYWQDGKPPEKILAGNPVDLALELKWLPQPAGPSVEEWRNILKDVPIAATAQVTLPNAGTQELKLRPEVLTTSPDGLLRLTGQLTGTRLPGTYEVIASIEVGKTPEAWSLKSRTVRFQAFKESPLSTPDRFSLAARLQKQGKLGGAVRMDQPQPNGKSPAVEMLTEPPARLVFEWWADPQKGCEGAQQLLIDVSSPEQSGLKLLFGPSRDALNGKALQEDGHRVCYRSAPELLTDAALGRPLIVQASDGLTSWQRTLLIAVPEPPGKRILRWLLYALLALLLATALA
ncbi:MAG: VWA domain-containing protein, partial [Acidobacteria bacterium]|nr:VWA domain-containing protein [Acidobacteriota bacterium]